uniref:Uncharacterized protein n=1 Tax=Anguilla anguilla TaxID=7936 RepID=A0A0E9S3W7_ANGAN
MLKIEQPFPFKATFSSVCSWCSHCPNARTAVRRITVTPFILNFLSIYAL